MKLREVTIENWRNIGKLHLDLSDGVNVFYGPNETGKSTVQEAIRHAFLVEPSSAARELGELVPWGSAAKASVVVIFDTGEGKQYRIEKSFPKGQGRLTLMSGSREQIVADGRNLQPAIYELLAVPPEASGLFDLLWIEQGRALDLFSEGRGPLEAGAAQSVVKRVIRENLLSGRGEELYESLVKERAELLTQNEKPRKNTPLYDALDRVDQLERERGALAKELSRAAETRSRMDAAEKAIAELTVRERDARELYVRLEHKREQAELLRPKIDAFGDVERRYRELLKLDAAQEELSREAPRLFARAEELLQLREVAELARRAELAEISTAISGLPARDREVLTEMERAEQTIREAEITLKAQELTLTLRPSESAPSAPEIELSLDGGASRRETIDLAKSYSAAREVRLELPSLEIDCSGPLTESEYAGHAGRLEEERKRLQALLDAAGCRGVAEARDSVVRFEQLDSRRREISAGSAHGGAGAPGAAERSEIESVRAELARLGIALDESAAREEAGGSSARSADSAAAADGGERALRGVIAELAVTRSRGAELGSRRSELLSGIAREELTAQYFALRDEIEVKKKQLAALEPSGDWTVDLSPLKAQRELVDRLTAAIAERGQERSALSAQAAAAIATAERGEEAERDYLAAKRELARERLRVESLTLLLSLMEEERERIDRDLVTPLQERVRALFDAITGGRYDAVDVSDSLRVGGVTATRLGRTVAVGVEALSHGTQEQLSFLFRLAVAGYLAEREPLVMMLDDSFVNTDAERLERIMHTAIDVGANIQYLLFTCHPEAYRAYRDQLGFAFTPLADRM